MGRPFGDFKWLNRPSEPPKANERSGRSGSHTYCISPRYVVSVNFQEAQHLPHSNALDELGLAKDTHINSDS